mmetsp:Transcript_6569/g.19791  ORF Transcript_6569/g.19791 Transcript_6569/m.19791 type:complete len:285 (+) Transcript_6569:97-951(+)
MRANQVKRKDSMPSSAPTLPAQILQNGPHRLLAEALLVGPQAEAAVELRQRPAAVRAEEPPLELERLQPHLDVFDERRLVEARPDVVRRGRDVHDLEGRAVHHAAVQGEALRRVLCHQEKAVVTGEPVLLAGTEEPLPAVGIPHLVPVRAASKVCHLVDVVDAEAVVARGGHLVQKAHRRSIAATHQRHTQAVRAEMQLERLAQGVGLRHGRVRRQALRVRHLAGAANGRPQHAGTALRSPRSAQVAQRHLAEALRLAADRIICVEAVPRPRGHRALLRVRVEH